ncbi:MAG: TonB-dependent receptor [Myxococcales bacterium]|nr:MAG: TonB-dependent receptor [Myxococcales bacterium]
MRIASASLCLSLLSVASGFITQKSQAQQTPNKSIEFSAKAEIQPPDMSPDQISRAQSRVTKDQINERIARSAPDALIYEPGVYVQQTAHGQASPFVRGLTGQQVLLMFDGIRLNNGTFRQGPNQYFFTVDALSIDHIDVIRGSASTRYGSDALGGAIYATPIDPVLDKNNTKLKWRPKIFTRAGTQDKEVGGRFQLGASIGRKTAAVAGFGYRAASRLESGGQVYNPGHTKPLVPRFEDDGRTQLGTGYHEGTFDLRVIHKLSPSVKVVGALYGFRQFDTPRTDQCPPPEAPDSECLWIDQQYRTLSYVAIRASELLFLRDLDLSVSYQRYDEQRRRERPRSYIRHQWKDAVDTLGINFRSATEAFELSEYMFAKLRFGFQGLVDQVSSSAKTLFTDLEQTTYQSRGLYIDGSRYFTLGLFSELEVYATRWLTLYTGARLSTIGARTPEDTQSETKGVNKNYSAIVGRFGLDIRLHENSSLFFNVDQGFRAPNLDDLSARTQVGPGFQYENPKLGPEYSTTFELGLRSKTEFMRADTWLFATVLEDAITRSVQDATLCPPETPACASSRARYQLINAPKDSLILGSEGALSFFFPYDLTLRASASYAWGQGPDLINPEKKVPLSRVPPLNGTAEARWSHPDTGFYATSVVRWALAQRRLAPSDFSDARIPSGGTPGYAVFDLRAGWLFNEKLALHLIFENIFDAPYRTHGSSINGPARGIRAFFSAAW